MPKKYRFGIYILANLILTLSYSCIAGLAAKVANDWFSKKETTIALVIPMATFEIVGAFAAYLVPQFIETTHDLYILAYLYLLSAGITCLSVLTCIQRSRPKLPPSRTLLEEASQSIAPLHEAIVLVSISDTLSNLCCIRNLSYNIIATCKKKQPQLTNNPNHTPHILHSATQKSSSNVGNVCICFEHQSYVGIANRPW